MPIHIINLMKYELVVFDLDGTILNTIDDLADSCNYILSQHNFPNHTVDEVRFMVGNGIPKLIERACPANISKEEYEAVLQEFRTWYANHCDIKTGPYEGMVDCIKQLKAAGIKVAVNTNKDEGASVALCNKHFPGLFDFISGSKPDIPVKPAPDGVVRIANQLFGKDISKVCGCYVGDSDVDVATGKNCGFDEIGCDWGFRGEVFLKEHGATVVVKTPAELLSRLL